MQPEVIYQAWVPEDGVWSLWARPVLFAQLGHTSVPEHVPLPDVSWTPDATTNAVLVLDLPGEESVHTGLAVAARGYRPVPLYNACTGPNEVIDQQGIMRGLCYGANVLPALGLSTAAPPAFLIDALRLTPGQTIKPGLFDNRWMVFPQDFPSGRFLRGQGASEVLLVQRGRGVPQEDFAHVLRRWQEAGLVIRAVDVAVASMPAERINVDPPPSYRSIFHQADAAFGLHPSSTGGFGGIVPEPSHG
jgi:hypothetical protein